MRLEQTDGIHVLTMDPEHQKINADFITGINGLLDEVDAFQGPAALVITGEGKSFNEGLDLPFLGSLGGDSVEFLKSLHALFGRLLRMDLPTMAAMNGHAIAGGAMLAQCADVRIMRADRGWYRLPEVELGLPFTTVMNDLVVARIPQPAVHRMMVLGQRVGGSDAAGVGAIDQAVDGEEGPRLAAMAMAGELKQFRGPVLRQIRMTRYRDLLDSIDRDTAREDLFQP